VTTKNYFSKNFFHFSHCVTQPRQKKFIFSFLLLPLSVYLPELEHYDINISAHDTARRKNFCLTFHHARKEENLFNNVREMAKKEEKEEKLRSEMKQFFCVLVLFSYDKIG
jgi:hypothetical protein